MRTNPLATLSLTAFLVLFALPSVFGDSAAPTAVPVVEDSNRLSAPQSLPPAFSETPQQLLTRFAAVQTTEKAAYQILFEEQTVAYGDSGSYSIATHEFVRVLTTEGVDQWSVLDVDWQPWRDSRPVLKARVIRPSGAESTLAQENVVESSSQDGDYNLRSDSKRLSAPLPNLEIGALVEFELVESGKEARAGAGYARRLFLALRGPVEERILRFEYPEKLPFTYTIAGIAPVAPERSASKGLTTLVFRFSKLAGRSTFDQLLPFDVPPAPTFTFGTAQSWNAVAKAYFEATEPLLDPKPVRDYALAALAGLDPASDPARAARLVADKLRHDVRYTGIYFGENAILAASPGRHSVRRLRRLQGSGESPRRLSALDRDRGSSRPARGGSRLRRRSRGARPRVFQSCDRLPSQARDVDRSHGYLQPRRRASARRSARQALVIGPDTVALSPIPKAASADNWYRVVREVALSESGKASRIVETVTLGGTLEENYRARYNSAPRKDRLDGLVKAGKEDFKSDKVEADFTDPLDLSTPFKTVVTAHDSSKGWTGDDTADYVMSGGDAFGQLPRELELDRSDHESRTADVYLPEATTVTVEYRVSAPAGFHINAVPDAYTTDMGPLRLDASFTSPDPQDLTSDFTLTTLKDRFSPADLTSSGKAAKTFFDAQAAVASFYNVGKEMLNAGRYHDALAEFRSLQALHPTEALHHVEASLALLSAGFAQDALAEAQKAVTLEPGSSNATRISPMSLFSIPSAGSSVRAATRSRPRPSMPRPSSSIPPTIRASSTRA